MTVIRFVLKHFQGSGAAYFYIKNFLQGCLEKLNKKAAGEACDG
jgi:hypothetical protein